MSGSLRSNRYSPLIACPTAETIGTLCLPGQHGCGADCLPGRERDA